MTSRRNVAALKCRKVNRVLARFAETHLQIREEYKAKGESVSQIKALNETTQRMREKSQCENTKKQLGAIDGIKIGDKFRYRGELVVIGLHHQSIKGIDYMWEDGISFATSILVTNRKDNTMNRDGSLTYVGEGESGDHKLEGGNLAMKNSMEAGEEVRVIMKLNENGPFSYMYDGLYVVNNMIQEIDDKGKTIFKFTLNKVAQKI